MIKTLFNRLNYTAVPRQILADLTTPFLNADVARSSLPLHGDAWGEAAELLRMGFDYEKDKGPLYKGLHLSLRIIGDRIANTPPESKTVNLHKMDLKVLRDTTVCFEDAARTLRLMHKQPRSPSILLTPDGQGNYTPSWDFSHCIALYNRPNGNHERMAEQLEGFRARLDTYFAGTTVKPATMREIETYIAPKYTR